MAVVNLHSRTQAVIKDGSSIAIPSFTMDLEQVKTMARWAKWAA